MRRQIKLNGSFALTTLLSAVFACPLPAQFQTPVHFPQPIRPANAANGNFGNAPPSVTPMNGPQSWQGAPTNYRVAANPPLSGSRVASEQQITAYQNPPVGVQPGSAAGSSGSSQLADSSGNATDNAENGSPSAKAPSDGKISMGNLLQVFHDGGIMMYPISLSSMICLVFVFERLIFLRRGRVIPRPFVKRLIEQLELQQLDRDEVLELCEKNPSPMSTVLAAAAKKYGRPAVEVEQAALDAGERMSNQLRKHLRIFSSISNLSPLFGLLGTVLGMIETFNAIASADAMGRPQLLAGGISQAMLSTAAGLIVAIPAYVAYTYFVGHTDRLVIEMDSFAQQVVEVISAEGLQESESPRSRNRSKKAA